MQNPWAELSGDSPCVLQTDRDAVDRVNDRFSLQPDFQIQSQLLPEPFIGTPTAAVYLLGLNPGYCPADDEWHNNTRFRHAIQNCLNHKPANLPFYFLDPQFVEAPGAIWWKQRTRWLKNEVELTTLAQNLFCVELFPYHSRRYKPIPKVISQNQLVPSSQYSVHLVRQAISTIANSLNYKPVERIHRALCDAAVVKRLFLHARSLRHGKALEPKISDNCPASGQHCLSTE